MSVFKDGEQRESQDGRRVGGHGAIHIIKLYSDTYIHAHTHAYTNEYLYNW